MSQVKLSIVHIILFQSRVEFKLITKLDYMFKINSFSCYTNSSLFIIYLINTFFCLNIINTTIKFIYPFTNIC
jgi:hypothetical protein